MNLSLGINFNLIIPFRPTKDTHGKSIQGRVLLICLAIAKLNQKYELKRFPSLVTISMQKILDIDSIHSEILMVCKSYNVIEWEVILVY